MEKGNEMNRTFDQIAPAGKTRPPQSAIIEVDAPALLKVRAILRRTGDVEIARHYRPVRNED